jgi:hypothetical protein
MEDQKSQEVTTMTLRSLFEKQIFIRLDEAHGAVVCTTKRGLLSRIKQFGIGECALDVAAEVAEPSSGPQQNESEGARS